MNKGDVSFQHDKYMIEDKLISQWGIWFIYKGESYEGNVHLITMLSSLADLAYFWLHSPIASLNNFFLSEDNRQKTYVPPYSATSLANPSAKSTPSSSSRRASNPSGKTNRIRKEEGSSSRYSNPSPTNNKSTKNWPSSSWALISREATKLMASDLSHPSPTTLPAFEFKFGSTSMSPTPSPLPFSRTSSRISSVRLNSSPTRRYSSNRWRTREPRIPRTRRPRPMTKIKEKTNEEMLIFVHRSFTPRKYIHPKYYQGFAGRGFFS